MLQMVQYIPKENFFFSELAMSKKRLYFIYIKTYRSCINSKDQNKATLGNIAAKRIYHFFILKRNYKYINNKLQLAASNG